jgi:hypothetical protein
VTGSGRSNSSVTITYEEGGRSQYGESPVTGMFGGNPLVGRPLTKHSVTLPPLLQKFLSIAKIFKISKQINIYIFYIHFGCYI